MFKLWFKSLHWFESCRFYKLAMPSLGNLNQWAAFLMSPVSWPADDLCRDQFHKIRTCTSIDTKDIKVKNWLTDLQTHADNQTPPCLQPYLLAEA